MSEEPALALRVDVCTYRGLRRGTPRLLDVLARHGVRATFCVAAGPDRSGLAVVRVLRQRGFLRKMLRTRALSMYGVSTALRGTLLPARRIAHGGRASLRRLLEGGHEIALHGWDHVRWQTALDRLDGATIAEDYARASGALEDILGSRPRATAAPAWLTSARSLEAVDEQAFAWASDTRGTCPFLPRAGGRTHRVPQVPVTLPTLDESLGRDAQSAGEYFTSVLDVVSRPRGRNVLAIHAEAEGIAHSAAFERFLAEAIERGARILTLGEFLAATPRPLPVASVERTTIDGRAGEVSVQR